MNMLTDQAQHEHNARATLDYVLNQELASAAYNYHAVLYALDELTANTWAEQMGLKPQQPGTQDDAPTEALIAKNFRRWLQADQLIEPVVNTRSEGSCTLEELLAKSSPPVSGHTRAQGDVYD